MSLQQGFTYQLREAVNSHIRKNWNASKAISFGDKYNGIEFVPNKDSFYNEIKDEIDEALLQKYGLENASRRAISKDSVRRFLDEKHVGDFNEKIKNAFSVFLGYEDYRSFCLAHDPPKGIRALVSQPALLTLGVLVIIFIGFTIHYFVKNRFIKKPDITLVNTEVQLGEAMKVSYDLADASYAKAQLSIDGILKDINERQGELEIYPLIPGCQKISLLLNGMEQMSKKFTVYSENWWASVNYAYPMPVSQFQRNGILQIRGFETKDQNGSFQAIFKNFRHFEVPADDFLLEANVKNSKNFGGHWPYAMGVRVTGRSEEVFLNLVAPDALIFAKCDGAGMDFQRPNKLMELNGLTVTDLSDWHHLTLKVRNHTVFLYLNEVEVFKTTYKKDIGELIGVTFEIQDAGSIKDVKIYDRRMKQVY